MARFGTMARSGTLFWKVFSVKGNFKKRVENSVPERASVPKRAS